MYVTGSTGKTEDRSKFLTSLDLFKKHNITTVFTKKKMEYFTCIQRSINPYMHPFIFVSSKLERVGHALFQFNDLLLQLLKII